MTEKEWLKCDDPHGLTSRCRSMVNPTRFISLSRDWCNVILDVIEQVERPYAEAFIRWVDGIGPHPDSLGLEPPLRPLDRPFHHVACARWCVDYLRWGQYDLASGAAAESAGVMRFPYGFPGLDEASQDKVRKVHLRFCDEFRDVAGNPFRPVAFTSSWRSSTALSLAAAIYESRAFDRMPVLADALEEAGCDDADFLAHCRGDGPHVRGCWVVDMLLGKE